MVVYDKLVVQDGMVLAVVQFMGIFYADDSLFGARDLEWLQESLKTIIGLF